MKSPWSQNELLEVVNPTSTFFDAEIPIGIVAVSSPNSTGLQGAIAESKSSMETCFADGTIFSLSSSFYRRGGIILDPLEKILQSLGMKNLNFSQDQKKVLKKSMATGSTDANLSHSQYAPLVMFAKGS